jgi:type II secretory pathway pseudopilin PulG
MAIVAALATVAATGYSAYSANQADKANQKNIAGFKKNQQDAMGFVPKVSPVTFDRLRLADIDKSFGEYLDQQKRLPELQRTANTFNSAWQNTLERTTPGLKSSLKLAGGLVKNRLLGNLSAETEANIARSGAYRSMAGGFGADSGAGRALEARDLGRTTEDMQTQGFSMLPTLAGTSASMNPVNVANLMMTPAQIMARRDAENQFNTQVSNSERAYNTSLDLENQNAMFQALMNKSGMDYSANAAGIRSTQARNEQFAKSGQQMVEAGISIYDSLNPDIPNGGAVKGFSYNPRDGYTKTPAGYHDHYSNSVPSSYGGGWVR